MERSEPVRVGGVDGETSVVAHLEQVHAARLQPALDGIDEGVQHAGRRRLRFGGRFRGAIAADDGHLHSGGGFVQLGLGRVLFGLLFSDAEPAGTARAARFARFGFAGGAAAAGAVALLHDGHASILILTDCRT